MTDTNITTGDLFTDDSSEEETEGTKKCNGCGKAKPFIAFNKQPHGKYGLRSHCKLCVAEYDKIKPVKSNGLIQRYYDLGMMDRVKDIKLERMLNNAVMRAKKRGVPCTLTLDDVRHLAVDVCPILKIPLTYLNLGRGPLPNSASLDKIIPSKGYVGCYDRGGNAVIISHLANSLKGAGNPEQLHMVAEWCQKQIWGTTVTEMMQ